MIHLHHSDIRTNIVASCLCLANQAESNYICKWGRAGKWPLLSLSLLSQLLTHPCAAAGNFQIGPLYLPLMKVVVAADERGSPKRAKKRGAGTGVEGKITKGLVRPARGNLRLCSRQVGGDERGLSQDSRPPLTCWSFGPCPALARFFPGCQVLTLCCRISLLFG